MLVLLLLHARDDSCVSILVCVVVVVVLVVLEELIPAPPQEPFFQGSTRVIFLLGVAAIGVVWSLVDLEESSCSTRCLCGHDDDEH